MIYFSCPKCQNPVRAPDDRSGFQVPCPRCKSPLVVPAASTGAPPLPAPNRPSQILPIPGGAFAPNRPSQVRLPPGGALAPTGPSALSSPSKKHTGARLFLAAALVLALVGGGAVAFLLSPWSPLKHTARQGDQDIA